MIADAPTMGNDLHASDTELPVLPQTPLRLADVAPVIAAPPGMSTEPRPITISPPSSLSTTGGLQTVRAESTTHVPRTVPIASPSADMSTPPSGLPRVPSALTVAPTMPTVPTMPTLPTLPTVPTLPAVPTVPTAATAASVSLVEPDLMQPDLMHVVHAVVEQEEARLDNAGPQHPMAHLMPQRTKPTEAQLRAAELRTSKKKKARRTKVLVVVAVVAAGVFVGPPLAAWVVDAINESGATTDQPDSTDGDPDEVNGAGTVPGDIDALTNIVTENNTDD